jgi:putative sterol carrier protein
MANVRVREGEDLNGLGIIIQQAIDTNLQDPRKVESIRKLEATLVVRDTISGAAVTLHFRRGDVEMHNGTIVKPSGTFEGTYENLGKFILGQVSPVWSVLTRKTKARGNILKLMKASKVIILKDGA